MKQRPSFHALVLATSLAALLNTAQARAPDAQASVPTYRGWVEEMKRSDRGPFSSIRWYCKDGTIWPPTEYACGQRGGGIQHGEWSERTQQLRQNGYKIANILASVDPAKAAAAQASAPDAPDTQAQLLIEKFLIANDDGWIFRRAQFYRGAVQEEDERKAARELLLAMAARPEWVGLRYPVLRTSARMLPHGRDEASMQKVRQMAASMAGRDGGFQNLRAKIHNTPELADAQRVRDYAGQVTDAQLRDGFEALATEIERVYRPQPLGALIAAAQREAAQRGESALQAVLADAGQAWGSATTDMQRYARSAQLMSKLRAVLPSLKTGAMRLSLIDLSLAAEAENVRLGTQLREGAAKASRRDNLQVLGASLDAAYGAGLLVDREVASATGALERLQGDAQELGAYMDRLRYLGLVPGWATQGLRFHFGLAVARLVDIEPKADLFIQDQLRGSPLLLYSQVLDMLARDADREAGVQHRIFGQAAGVGLHALNPGLARGTLVTRPDMKRLDAFRPSGIYVLPETVAELTPVGGILTTGAGNPLSHVQLLARNLGIPNVAIDESVLSILQPQDGRPIVLAVSAAGLVEIANDGPDWARVFGNDAAATSSNSVFEADLKKLDLTRRDFISLDKLRADDSGRIVGPKAAKVGELKARFPDHVVPGVAIPFGLYRQVVLERPYKATGQSFYDWMVQGFRALEALPEGSPEAAQASEKLRAEIYDTIMKTDPGPQFRDRLRAALAQEFGAGFKGGVFVRSDTNVEDLPGFTGAGLNLTLPNVVGFDNVMKALAAVWASPYTPRAWAWRQSHMRGPEHVYPAVLLMQTVPSEKSGVMITQDVDTGDTGVLSVAVNEGVGGAVDGQAAESLRVDMSDQRVRLMARATAPTRMVPKPGGGVAVVPSSGADTVLQAPEIRALTDFAREIPRQFPQLDVNGAPTAADVEFAFVQGKLWLLQIRPFNESRQARSNQHLIDMDRALAEGRRRRINLLEAAR